MYICANCGREIDKLEHFVRCPFCAFRVLFKPSLPIARTVSSD